MRWLIILAPLLLAPPTDTDQQFLNMLTANGITYTTNDVIGYAHGICQEMSQQAFPAIVNNITHDYPKLPRAAADLLAVISIKYYCPEYETQIDKDRTNGIRIQ